MMGAFASAAGIGDTQMDLHEFDLRFNDRVLGFHAFVNTDRDPSPMSLQMQRAAKGPRLDASVCWMEGYNDGTAVWAEMLLGQLLHGEEAPALRAECSRVLVFHLFVNTDADPYHIHKAILRIARGENLDATVCWTELYEGDGGRKAWLAVQDIVKQAAADPRAKPYSL